MVSLSDCFLMDSTNSYLLRDSCWKERVDRKLKVYSNDINAKKKKEKESLSSLIHLFSWGSRR